MAVAVVSGVEPSEAAAEWDTLARQGESGDAVGPAGGQLTGQYPDPYLRTIGKINASRDGQQNIDNLSYGTSYKVTYETPHEDQEGWWDSANSRYVPQRAGTYWVGGVLSPRRFCG